MPNVLAYDADLSIQPPADEVTPRTMSPPRELADASKLSFPLPLTITAIVFALGIGGAVWSIASDVRNINTRLDYEGQIKALEQKYLDQRFATLEAKIESAGLRNALSSVFQDQSKQFQDKMLKGK